MPPDAVIWQEYGCPAWIVVWAAQVVVSDSAWFGASAVVDLEGVGVGHVRDAEVVGADVRDQAEGAGEAVQVVELAEGLGDFARLVADPETAPRRPGSFSVIVGATAGDVTATGVPSATVDGVANPACRDELLRLAWWLFPLSATAADVAPRATTAIAAIAAILRLRPPLGSLGSVHVLIGLLNRQGGCQEYPYRWTHSRHIHEQQ